MPPTGVLAISIRRRSIVGSIQRRVGEADSVVAISAAVAAQNRPTAASPASRAKSGPVPDPATAGHGHEPGCGSGLPRAAAATSAKIELRWYPAEPGVLEGPVVTPAELTLRLPGTSQVVAVPWSGGPVHSIEETARFEYGPVTAVGGGSG